MGELGLLHKFSWPKHSTSAEICVMYIRQVRSIYGHALDVFVGYYGSSTKSISVEHAGGDDDYTNYMLARLSAIKKPPAVVAEGSDVFQLLTHHVDVTDKSENSLIGDLKTVSVHR